MSPLDQADYLDTPPPARRIARKAALREQRKQIRSKRAHPTREREPLVPRNEAQSDLLDALNENLQVFAIGPAGTGKTYLAARHAIRQVLDARKERLFIARPTVSKQKHRMGFLPGNADDKLEPWLVPIMDALKVECSAATIAKMRHDKQIEFLAFEHMRGRTLANAVVILDEAQNCDLGDLKLFLTRTGDGTQIIVCGDMDQVDIPDTGLERVVNMIDEFDLTPDVIEFDDADVVRSPAAKEWVGAFSRL
jgi:phosphate starvation-inducible PhoH-like protein